MQYRTDLAIENQELLEEVRERATGYIKKQQQKDEDICVTEIIITDETGEKAFGKSRGTYITVEIEGIAEQKDGIKNVPQELCRRTEKADTFRLLSESPGGWDSATKKVTPDSLGPHTVDKVKITSHLFQIFGADGDWEMANVSGFNPSVTGVTGMETADLIEKVTSMVKPDVAVIIDSLAARSIERLSTHYTDMRYGNRAGSRNGQQAQSHHPGDFRLQSGFHRRTYSHRLQDSDHRSV